MSTAEERPDKSSQHHSEQYSGLYRGSEAYRTAAAADYRSVFTTGIVVLDSSVLLNLYRYSANTRRDLFGVLNGLHDQLWVPHQVIAEFWKNREKVLQDPRDTIRTLSELSSLRDQAIQCVRLLATRVEMTGRNAENLVQSLAAGFDPVTEAAEDLVEQEKALRAYIENTKVDPVLTGLEPILHGRVGSPFNEAEYREAIAEARRRTLERIPPGYKDSSKSEDAGARDYFLWRQVLLEAQARHCDVLLVTGDLKDDWWRREGGQIRGPRPELVEELRRFADSRLFMFRPEELLIHAGEALSVRIRNKSVQDVERVERIWEGVAAESIALQLATLRATWTNILEEVKKRSTEALSLLEGGTLSAFRGNDLTIEFGNEAESRLFAEKGYGELLAKTIYRYFAVNVTVRPAYRSTLESDPGSS